jgi:hypothetical protein
MTSDHDSDDETSHAVNIATTLILGGMEIDEAVRMAEDLYEKYKAAMREWGEMGCIRMAEARRRVADELGLPFDEEEEAKAAAADRALIATPPDESDTETQLFDEIAAPSEAADGGIPLPADWLKPRGKQTLN